MCARSLPPAYTWQIGTGGGDRTEDFDKLFRAQFPTVARSLGLVVGNREEGIELAQEAFARAWARWDRYQSPEHVRNSVMHIAVNLARSEARRRKKLSNTPVESLPDEGHPSKAEDVPTRVAIVDALSTLSDRQRTCVVLTDYAGMDSREVARMLHIPAGSVRTHVTRARRRLRTLLDEGIEEAQL
jgi:RNA polymerase sigma-70 factor (ECF subfamily)